LREELLQAKPALIKKLENANSGRRDQSTGIRASTAYPDLTERSDSDRHGANVDVGQEDMTAQQIDDMRRHLIGWALEHGCPQLRFHPWASVVGTQVGWRTFVNCARVNDLVAAVAATQAWSELDNALPQAKVDSR
jgi:hypothetical protein